MALTVTQVRRHGVARPSAVATAWAAWAGLQQRPGVGAREHATAGMVLLALAHHYDMQRAAGWQGEVVSRMPDVVALTGLSRQTVRWRLLWLARETRWVRQLGETRPGYLLTRELLECLAR